MVDAVGIQRSVRFLPVRIILHCGDGPLHIVVVAEQVPQSVGGVELVHYDLLLLQGLVQGEQIGLLFERVGGAVVELAGGEGGLERVRAAG